MPHLLKKAFLRVEGVCQRALLTGSQQFISHCPIFSLNKQFSLNDILSSCQTISTDPTPKHNFPNTFLILSYFPFVFVSCIKNKQRSGWVINYHMLCSAVGTTHACTDTCTRTHTHTHNAIQKQNTDNTASSCLLPRAHIIILTLSEGQKHI